LLEDAVENRYGSKKVKITTSDQGPLLLKIVYHTVYKNDKYAKTTYSVPIVLEGRDNFVSVLELVEKECADFADVPDEAIMKCLYRKGVSPTLYAKIDEETDIYSSKGGKQIDHKKLQNERFHLDAVIKVENLYVSNKTVSIQVKLYEGKILEEKPREPRKRPLR
jgi:hypothetical protein